MIKKKHEADTAPLVRFQRGMVLPSDEVARIEALRALEETITSQYQAAKTQGYADGLKKAVSDCEKLLEEAEVIAYRRVEDSQSDVLTLALKLAELILHQAVTTSPEALEKMVVDLMENLPNRGDVEVIVGSMAHDVLRGGDLRERLKLDEGAAPWGVRLVSPAGQIEAGFEAQLAKAERGLRGG